MTQQELFSMNEGRTGQLELLEPVEVASTKPKAPSKSRALARFTSRYRNETSFTVHYESEQYRCSVMDENPSTVVIHYLRGKGADVKDAILEAINENYREENNELKRFIETNKVETDIKPKQPVTKVKVLNA